MLYSLFQKKFKIFIILSLIILASMIFKSFIDFSNKKNELMLRVFYENQLVIRGLDLRSFLISRFERYDYMFMRYERKNFIIFKKIFENKYSTKEIDKIVDDDFEKIKNNFFKKLSFFTQLIKLCDVPKNVRDHTNLINENRILREEFFFIKQIIYKTYSDQKNTLLIKNVIIFIGLELFLFLFLIWIEVNLLNQRNRK